MALEIELKLKVDSFEPVIEKLNSLGAVFDGDFHQTDYYFDDNENSLVNSDRCLRIRRQTCQDGEQMELTYKGARENHRFKSRREIGLELQNATQLVRIFAQLGYEEKLIFEKRRSLWRLDNCYIALDELPILGKFIEIEGPGDKAIEAVQQKLGLGSLTHIEHSYAHLVEQAVDKTDGRVMKVMF